MDKQELYVAASRSREGAFIYATPEIHAHREEIAPESPHLREGIPHIAEAAERDRAQLAGHDEVRCSQFSGLPTRSWSPDAPSCDLLQTMRRAGRVSGAACRSGSSEPATITIKAISGRANSQGR